MELQEHERRALAEAALIGGNEFRWKNYRLRCMTLGSMMQLQRIGNPYSRLGEINLAPDENGRHPSMWEALGVTDKAQIVYYLAEFLWVHMGEPGRSQGRGLCARRKRGAPWWKRRMGIPRPGFGRIGMRRAGGYRSDTGGHGESGDGRGG